MNGPGAGFRALLGDRPFRWFLLSQSAGSAGYAVYSIAIVWLALEITGSLFWAGVALFVEIGIYALSFIAGPTVDRSRDLHTIFLIGFPLQAVAAAAIGLLALSGRLDLVSLLVGVVALSVLWDFTWTATNATLPRIVGEGQLFGANGLVSAAGAIDAAAGFVVGGALLLVVGPGVTMLLYAGFNLAAGLLALPLHVPKEASAPRGFTDTLSDGFAYLRSAPGRPAFELSMFSAAQGILSSAPALLIALVASTRYPRPTFAYGLLFVAFALGGAAGSLLVGVVNPRARIAEFLVGAAIVEGTLTAVSVLAAPSYPLGLPGWFGVGVADTLFFTTALVYLQATTPPVLLGRTVSNTYVMRGGARACGALLVGGLAVSVMPDLLGAAVGAFFVGVGLLGALAFRGRQRLAF